VAPDGKRFLMLQKVPDGSVPNQAARPNLLLIENWFEEFRQRQ
jgi:hypothetical protein